MHFKGVSKISLLGLRLKCAKTLQLATRILRGGGEMTTIHGSVAAFDPSKEDWTIYIERLTQYFVANDVNDAEKKRAILLSACGPATFKLIRSLIGAEVLATTSYTDIVARMKEHYDPKPSVIVQRFKFNSRIRAVGETIATYVAALRELAQHCDYRETLSDMIRDRIVCGVNDEKIQKRLLSERDLSYDRAMEIALAMEAADKDTRVLNAPRHTTAEGTTPPSTTPPTENVHYNSERGASNSGREDRKVVCYRCGGNHLATVCRYKDVECRSCRKKGHIARMCGKIPAKARGQKRKKPTIISKRKKKKQMSIQCLHSRTLSPKTPL